MDSFFAIFKRRQGSRRGRKEKKSSEGREEGKERKGRQIFRFASFTSEVGWIATKDFIDEGSPPPRNSPRGNRQERHITNGGKAGGNADQNGHKFRSKETERGRCVGLQSTMSAAATTDRDRPVAWSVAVAGSRSQGAGESTEEFENMRQSVSLSFAQLRLYRSIARSPRNSQPHNTLALHSLLARPPPPPRPRMPSADLAPPLRGFTRY